MSFKYASHHLWWYATQESHGATYVVLTLSLLIWPVWPSTYDELVSLRQKKNNQTDKGLDCVDFGIHRRKPQFCQAWVYASSLSVATFKCNSKRH